MGFLDFDLVPMTKKFAKTQSAKEILKMYEECYDESYEKEDNQHKFRKGKSIQNMDTGEVFDFIYDFEKEQKKYYQSIQQKIFALEQLAQDYGLVPIFITFTLPSRFHPVISRKYKGIRKLAKPNENFAFQSIEDAIREGYAFLQKEIFRNFYKRIKNYDSNILYIKAIEPHKTLIPHMHLLLFVTPINIENIEKVFRKIIQEFNLHQTKLDSHEFVKDIKKATKYIMKYLQKNQQGNISYENNLFFRVLDGWERKFRIRLITSTNLPLSIGAYRRIYQFLDEEVIETIRKICIDRNISIFYEFYTNLYIRKVVKVRDSPPKIREYFAKDAKYRLYIEQIKLKDEERKKRDTD
ncbi:replication endonuclease [Nitratiruptor sp. YY09-18]|uniref:replication endonuclease n=1 Tax=Nitratiruptor sp. YY09-18 TaxID=2724901 RepID=UPI001915A07F|nr:replication endonuclease [Nitratiruptor sp. YY09-18]BCD67606.1 hypothetical protein NitYY0918_C0505 [Nitratiruptor sp. YY09-18]